MTLIGVFMPASPQAAHDNIEIPFMWVYEREEATRQVMLMSEN
jgi:hypothetical protein